MLAFEFVSVPRDRTKEELYLRSRSHRPWLLPKQTGIRMQKFAARLEEERSRNQQRIYLTKSNQINMRCFFLVEKVIILLVQVG